LSGLPWHQKSMRTKSLWGILFSLWGDVLFAHPSLFFTEEDIKAIRDKARGEKDDCLKLHLSALIYMDKNHWCLWVNHKIIRPETRGDIDGFYLESVMPHKVTFSWTPPESLTPKTFTLYPSQTYSAKK
jgi:hypothetical protein